MPTIFSYVVLIYILDSKQTNIQVIINKYFIKIIKYLFPEDNLHVSPLERSYKSKVLAHYPENVSSNPFDESAVCMVFFLYTLLEKTIFLI